MTRSLDDANRAITGVRRMPFGLARNEVAAEILREVDAEGPETALAYALFALVESYVFSQEVEKAFLPFTRSVRLWDERPELFDADDTHSLFWSFKWMVGDLMSYPAIPATQIQATIEDMERRYRLAGNGLSAVNHLKFEWHQLLGDEALPASYDAWVATERDDFSQCPACEPGDRTTYLFAEGRFDEGIRLLETAQEAGAQCRTEPADMLSQLQLAYLEVGDAAGAARAHRRGLVTLDSSGEMCSARGRHIQFLARTQNTSAALRLLLRYQMLLTRTETPRGRWAFLTAAGTGVAALRSTDPDTPVTLDDVPAGTIAELDDWMRAQALSLAAEFDRRAGTSTMTERTLRAWSGDQVRMPVDLSVLTGDHTSDRSSTHEADSAHSGAGDPGRADDRDGERELPSDPVDDAAPGSSPSPRSSPAGLSPDALVSQAERLTDTDPVTAARLYAQASSAFTDSGELEAAGFALAEAALLSDHLGDVEGAAQTADAALTLLTAAGTGIVYAGPVVRVAARLHTTLDAGAHAVDLLTSALDTAAGELSAGAAAEAAAGAGAEAPADATSPAALERAHLLDTRARVHASCGSAEAAACDARDAAEAFATQHRTSDAAHALWLAGRVERGRGRPDQAVAYLESAAEGFALTRSREQHLEVTGDLIETLTELGRTEDAAALVTGLAG